VLSAAREFEIQELETDKDHTYLEEDVF